MRRVQFFLRGARGALFAAALTPLVVIPRLISGEVWGKAVWLQVAVEIAAACTICAALWGWRPAPCRKWNRRALLPPLLLTAFAASVLAATAAAASPWMAWWGTLTRAEGAWILLHYAAFAVLCFLLFEERHWKIWWMAVAAGGGIAAVIGLAERIIAPGTRPSATLGNPAFLASYLLLAGAAAVAAAGGDRRLWVRRGGWAVAALAAAAVMATGSRASLGGLLVGIGVFGGILLAGGAASRRVKRNVVAVMVAVLLAALVVGATRHWSGWRVVPGIRRVVTSSPEDTSLHTRLLALRAANEAFWEHPLIGWGPEHALVALNAHYIPGYLVYEEAWFDRVHNIVADVAVMRGIAGLLASAGMLAFTVGVLFARSRRTKNYGVAALGAGVIAYLTQDLFFFDHPSALLLLFAIFAFAWRLWDEERSVLEEGKIALQNDSRLRAARGAAAAAVGGLAVYLIVMTAVVPLAQLWWYSWKTGIATGNKVVRGAELLRELPWLFSPYTVVQPELRRSLVDMLVAGGAFQRREFAPLTKIATAALAEAAWRQQNYDPRLFLTLAEAYNELGKHDARFLARGKEVLEAARRLAPKRQDYYALLAFNRLLAGEKEQAVALARTGVALAPTAPRPRLNLGILLALAGKTYWNESLRELDRLIESYRGFSLGDVRNMVNVLGMMVRGFVLDSDAEGVEKAAAVIQKVGMLGEGKIYAALRENGALLENLAQQGNWRALREMVGAVPSN